MDIKSLMIGDYVSIGISKYYQVEEIRKECGEYRFYLKGTSVFATESEIKPIPLTPEILEKNGFERTWQDNFVYDNEDIGLIITFHPKETNYTNGTYNYIDIERGCMTITEMPIEFVHQLQHALRLCGISKQIEL